MDGRYSIELFNEGGENASVEQVLSRYENLSIARACFRANIKRYPGRLIMLLDRIRVSLAAIGRERCHRHLKARLNRRPLTGTKPPILCKSSMTVGSTAAVSVCKIVTSASSSHLFLREIGAYRHPTIVRRAPRPWG